jgi:hypothetical protein
MHYEANLRKRGTKTASHLVNQLRTSDDANEWRKLSMDLIPIFTAYWDVHPHSAMEVLEAAVHNLPLELAHPLVRTVVLAWRKKATYSPDAGGTADHCYLSALILSENYDLAEHPWAKRVLPYTLDKDLRYRREMRDRGRKLALLEAFLKA